MNKFEKTDSILIGVFSTIVGALIGIAILLALQLHTTQAQRNGQVDAICQYSRVNPTDTLRELCTKAQTATKTEFLCTVGNKCSVRNK